MENKNELNIKNIPLACNFERYNNYLLPSEEICLFEWIVKTQIFRYGFCSFYASMQTIEKEVKIKRKTIERIVKRFSEMGFIKTEVKPLPSGGGRVTYYCAMFSTISRRLHEIIDKESETFTTLQKYYKFCSDMQKQTNKTRTTKKERISKEVNSLFEKLNDTYKTAIERHNAKSKKKKDFIEIPKKGYIKAANEMLKTYEEKTIYNAFLAFCENRLEEDGGVNIGTFFSFDKTKNKYSVLEYFIQYFIRNYAYE